MHCALYSVNLTSLERHFLYQSGCGHVWSSVGSFWTHGQSLLSACCLFFSYLSGAVRWPLRIPWRGFCNNRWVGASWHRSSLERLSAPPIFLDSAIWTEHYWRLWRLQPTCPLAQREAGDTSLTGPRRSVPGSEVWLQSLGKMPSNGPTQSRFSALPKAAVSYNSSSIGVCCTTQASAVPIWSYMFILWISADSSAGRLSANLNIQSRHRENTKPCLHDR